MVDYVMHRQAQVLCLFLFVAYVTICENRYAEVSIIKKKTYIIAYK